MSVRKTVFDAMAMSLVGVVRILAQFLTIPIMARILSPSDYGLVAMATPFLMFSMMIADSGIATSLVRTPTENSKEWSTCFWLSLMLGAGLAIIMIATAPLISMLFEEPRLSPIIMVLSAVVFIQSTGAVHNSALLKEQKFKIIASGEGAAILIGIAVAVFFAMYGYGAWALVFQQLAYYGVKIGTILIFSSFRPKRQFDIKSVSEHIRFGKDILANSMIGFFTRSIDNLVIGKFLDVASVGVYSMAFQFARLPTALVTGPLQSIFYPKMVKLKDDKAAIRKSFLILTRILATIIFPSMGMVAVAHHSFFAILLSEKWQASGRIFMLVAGVMALQAVMNWICNTVRQSLGQTRQQVRQTIEQGIIWVVTMFSTIWFGLEWLAISYSVVFFLYSPRILMLTLPQIECSIKEYIKAIIMPIVVTFTCIIAFILIQSMFQLSDIMQLMIAAIIMMVGVVTSGLLQYPVFINEYRLMKSSAS